MATKVFINYRREDARADARHIRDRLARVYGRRKIFMDIYDLEAGQRFDRELQTALDRCNVCLVVIGDKWLSILRDRQRDGKPDYVRQEIASALRRPMLIIPVTIDGAPLPSVGELPEDIEALALHLAHEVTHTRFERDLDELKTKIRNGLRRRPGTRIGAWRHPLGLAALVLLLGLAVPLAWYGMSQPNGTAVRPAMDPPADSPVTAGLCSEVVTFACLRAGLVRGHIASDLRQTECTVERKYSPAELRWRSIWTTSVYSYAPGESGPGGGKEDDDLRVGGWGDLYYTLMQFETPRLSKPVRFAAVLLYSKTADGSPVAMHLDRITRSWDWKAGDRLWWNDRPSAAFVTSITQPAIGRWYAIEITHIVEHWRLGLSVNHGLQLRPADNNRRFNTFHSTRSPEASKRPQLLVCT